MVKKVKLHSKRVKIIKYTRNECEISVPSKCSSTSSPSVDPLAFLEDPSAVKHRVVTLQDADPDTDILEGIRWKLHSKRVRGVQPHSKRVNFFRFTDDDSSLNSTLSAGQQAILIAEVRNYTPKRV